MRVAVGIVGTGMAVPEKVLTNQDLERLVDTSDEWITTRTGIRERRIAGPHEATSDFAAAAGRRCLDIAGVAPDQVGLVIVGTVTPDMPFPSAACLVQAAIGARDAACFDLAAGCTGFIYALEVARCMLDGGSTRPQNALVIGADTLSKITDYTDRNTCVLFGDGAGAVLLGKVPDGYGVVRCVLGADGNGANLLHMPAGGSRLPASHDTVEQRRHFVRMEGNAVYRFAVSCMASVCDQLLEECGVSSADVALLIAHQANKRIIDAAASRMGLEPARVLVNIDRYGNTSAASIPIALDEVARAGRLRDGDLVLLVAFGAGLTWGGAAIRWWDGWRSNRAAGA